MYATRRKGYSIFRRSPEESTRSLLAPESQRSSGSDWDRPEDLASLHPPKTRRIFGRWTVRTPNSSRFARHLHSRILQKFPFLVEMWYWAIALVLYRGTILITSHWYGGSQGLWDIAQRHGTSILEFEARITGMSGVTDNTRWIEWRIQQWFLTGASLGDWRGGALQFLNRAYALIHIPGTAAYVFDGYLTISIH
jgi:hypothetical protein